MTTTRTRLRSAGKPALHATVAAIAASLALTACSSDDPAETSSGNGSNGDAMTSSPEDQTFGPGCSAIPDSGAGSFDGMATEPVATAASANPLLTTLVAAVGAAGLGDTLNSAEAITVFAPTDDAFAEIPADTLEAVLADTDTLTAILTHHVVAGQLSPDEVAGTHETLGGTTLVVRGSGERFTVGNEEAAVLCGNIPTSNATVYVIDTVMMP
ncbi:fasciclin domain-containing protein [Nocardioides limicola]|uniref:fasciclin domain-containing protein n=1 Tax=Nocardioides limicola TaxID=2803368 RepID=UPI00193BF0DF|nr:fasciclin domain-containing protein [Nocardioides sp. DJM-14]